MKNTSTLLLRALLVACVLAASPGPAAAYIKSPPQTLGSICLESDHISVLKVEKFSAENGVLLFKHVEQLKGTHDGTVVKHVIRPEIKGARVILDWAAEGKTAVMFYFTGGNDRGHVYIDGYWYWVGGVNSSNPEDKKARPNVWWSAVQGEPMLLALYCGTADQLADAAKKILRGEEVVVPAMVGDNKQDLEQRRAKIQDVRASQKIVGADTLARIASRSIGKKPDVSKPAPDDKKPIEKKPDGKQPEPGEKKPEEKKGEVRKPDRFGTVKTLSADGKSFSLQPASSEKNKEPAPVDIQIGENTRITAGKEPGRLTVGQMVSVWFGKGSENLAAEIQIGKPPEQPEKKPVDKKPTLFGTVKTLSGDGKSFTLQPAPMKTDPQPATIDIQIGENTRITSGKEPGKLAVGQAVTVALEAGAAKVAADIQIGKPPEKTEKKPDDKKPALFGTVKALSVDGKSFTLQPSPTKTDPQSAAFDIQIGANTRILNGKEPGTLAVGQIVNVRLEVGAAKVAAEILIGKPPEKTEKKPEDKKPALVGTVKALSGDGKSFTLQPAPTKTDLQPPVIEIQIGANTRILNGKDAGKLAVGQAVTVALEAGVAKVAVEIQIGKPPELPAKKPAPPEKGGKPETPEKKPDEPKKPREPAKPVRDPAPTAALIDTEVDRNLAREKIPASPETDDAEFLRRVTLDLTGRVPTYQQTVAFLDSKDPDKRRKLIDELLDSPEYGDHFATIWRRLLVRETVNITGKGGGTDTLRPWLTERFNDNHGWNAIVTELLTAEGTPSDNPATTFLLANSENNQPRANKIAGSTAALFLGVNLRCAECHTHPFAPWKQNDFWGTAAFFGKVQYGGGKGGPLSLVEVVSSSTATKEKGQSAPIVRGSGIVIPASSGKAAGQVVKARFLGADEPALDENAPFRPRFAAWATAADNPYFARAAVNRMWAHFFGRGFVNPLDAFDTGTPSHPELLDRLAKEFAASGFDFKHLARCITMSKAYQRTSNPVAGNEADTAAFSHMAVKVLTPEVFYDSLAVIGKGPGNLGKDKGEKQESREQFLSSFRFDEEATATEYIQGIPQLLRLMNASSLNRGVSVIDRLYSSRASHPEAITTIYLTVLSRRPTSEELELMSSYLSRRKDDREGYRGILWILLNSSEFALNR